MGLDAVVWCRCLEDGHAKPAPIAVRYDVSDGVTPVHGVTLAEVELFDEWLATACVHPDMKAVSVHLGNWGSVSQFRMMLERLGASTAYGALIASIPTANDGATSPTEAAEALRQLDAFASSSEHWVTPVLVDATTGDVVGERLGNEDGVFIFTAHLEGGLDMDGRFFVRERGSKAVVFQATEFSQELVVAHALPRAEARLASGATSMTWPVLLGASGDRTGTPNSVTYPTSLRVELRHEGPSSFRLIIEALRSVFDAAVANEHTVCWT